MTNPAHGWTQRLREHTYTSAELKAVEYKLGLCLYGLLEGSA